MGEVIKMRANDSLRSVVAGLGDPMRDKMAMTTYGFQMLDELQIANIYRSNWMGRKAVDIPALDAVRKGRDWQAEQDQIELIEAEQNRLGFWKKLLDVLIKARLWGGAALYIGTGDTNLSLPLDPARIGKGGIKYLTVMSRRDLAAGEIDQDVMSEFYGKPSYYEVTGNSANSMVRIHPSRFAIFIGADQADSFLTGGINQGWGDSVLESVYSAMKNADATAANIASLVFEANVDVFRIPEFMSSLSDPEYSKRLMDRFMLAATAKGINRALLLDKEEEYERKTISFATLPDILQKFIEQYCGAVDIPVTRFMGTAPSGLGSNGDHSMSNYHDMVASKQALEITPAIYRLDECLIRSALGSRPPEIFYTWAPLEQMSEKELAEIGKMNAETAEILGRTGIFTSVELRAVVGNQLVESGFYPGLDQTMDDTGKDFDPVLGGDDTDEEEVAPPQRQAANDAAPRTLYVRRDVINRSDIVKWATAQGFTDIVPDLHVTIAYSTQPVDWFEMGESWSSRIEMAAGGPRQMEGLGDNGEYKALLITASELVWRHKHFIEQGASWSWPEYQPHISIQIGGDIDLSKVEPYQGKIILGPEIFEELRDD
ncbi:anti-CBASS protein Acb1 family protein [Agrobacterium tumefaciens]|uniref:anti-CBASS protein Acb1 family protein n=1 Tax=Agrobacterium tumefaciens TaxID=358 RepID=UPI00054EC593|nr:anti-CBASS Acb1 family protein [Agrobacterium tumefaciens]